MSNQTTDNLIAFEKDQWAFEKDQWAFENHHNKIAYGYKITEKLYEKQSNFQNIKVVQTEFYGRMLLLDDLVQTTEGDEFIYHELIAHIPLLAHPNPKRVLVIGGGDGGTVREVLKHPSIEEVVLCEIDGDVIDASRQYLPGIASRLEDPRVDIQVRDGIEYIAQQNNRFDVIIIDSSDPVGPGVGLFTKEFYENVKAALTHDGIMVNQSESPMAQVEGVQKIYELLRSVFKLAIPYCATVPTYPGGYWTWAFCSNGDGPLHNINHQVAANLEQTTRFYNMQVHRAVFALPNFIRERIEGTNTLNLI